MFHRISSKLVVAVLAAVVLPFVVFAVFIDFQVKDRLKRNVVQQALLGLSRDIAARIDSFVIQRRQDVALWSGAPSISLALDNHQFQLGRARAGREEAAWDAATVHRYATEGPSSEVISEQNFNLANQTHELNRYVELKKFYDLLLLVDAEGRVVTSSCRSPSGEPLPEDYLQSLFARSFDHESWFRQALEGELHMVDQHRSPYQVHQVRAGTGDQALNYHMAVAAPVRDQNNSQKVRGVLFALINWSHIQEVLGQEVLVDYFSGMVDPGQEERIPPYGWIWRKDADTIIAHRDRSYYHQSVSFDVKLPQMTEAVRANAEGWGLYPEYMFEGKAKNAAFKRCLPEDQGGFDWVVGVGINNDDIFGIPHELRRLLLGSGSVVLVLSVVLTLLVARRTTAPILELQRTARRVAEGDMDARIQITSRDELGALAEDFNVMTRELTAQRKRIVKAEKDAAWREMARQIAHDIKNPLTPIQLSLDLLERARREDPEGSEAILERTMGLMRRQVENLRRIAGDFYDFTGGRKPEPTAIDVGELLDEVLHLHDAWAVEQGVAMQREGPAGVVIADRGKLHRVFVNLVSNALQAMPNGGELRIDAGPSGTDGKRILVRIRDTGVGLDPEVGEHLFEPYFTTKSEGTGLGLAISRRVVEELKGEIALEPADDGRPGTVATVVLPCESAARDASGDSPAATPAESSADPGGEPS